MKVAEAEGTPTIAWCSVCGEALYPGFDPYSKTDWEAVSNGRKWDTHEREDGELVHWECGRETEQAKIAALLEGTLQSQKRGSRQDG